jgi:hypothetical protein
MGKINKLENDLIPPIFWNKLYYLMPKKCREVVKGPPDCIGIGRNKKYGWFIMGAGQGPSLLWSEKENK